MIKNGFYFSSLLNIVLASSAIVNIASLNAEEITSSEVEQADINNGEIILVETAQSTQEFVNDSDAFFAESSAFIKLLEALRDNGTLNDPTYNLLLEAAQAEEVGESVPSVAIEEMVEPDESGFDVSTNSEYAREILDFQNTQANKDLDILRMRQAGVIKDSSLYLSGQLRASSLLSTTNTENSFPYFGRFPTPTNFSGTSASDTRINQANIAFTVNITPWASVYFETLFSDVFTFPTFNQGSWQVREAYAVIGDLERSPFYGYVGKKDISFGDMSTLSPFTQSIVWHYFSPLAEGFGLGYYKDGLHLKATGINGGRGIRVVDSASVGNINNVAVNASYERDFGEANSFRLGVGYLSGTIYNAAVAEHTDPLVFDDDNAAWDVNAYVKLGDFELGGEYVQTFDEWPVVGNKVTAYRLEGAYNFELFELPSKVSISWSEGIQGGASDEFNLNQQLVLGLSAEPSDNLQVGVEYVRSSGFAPLINITTVSNNDVVQDSVVFFGNMTF